MSLAGAADFGLERYFAQFEFSVKHQLSASDVECMSVAEVLALADDDGRRRWDSLTLGYTESQGLPALRDAIAAQYRTLKAKDVLVVAGAEEGILLLMHALISAGDEAVVVTPAYQSLEELPRSLGGVVKTVPLRAENRWQLDADEIARAVTPKTRLIVVNFPHNPTGSMISPDVQQRLLEIADRANAVLFSDEVYRGLEVDERTRLPAAADLSNRAVSLGVMSKSFAMPGVRIGWLATKNAALLDRVARLKDYTTICSSAPSEILSLIALRAADKVLARSRAIVDANRKAAAEFMAANVHHLEWVAPLGGSTALPRLRNHDPDALATKLREQQSVLMLPGSLFGIKDHFRLGLGRRDLTQALAALARSL